MIKEEKKDIVPVSQKYLLTVNEAAAYFNIGSKKIRRIAEEYIGELSLYSGNRLLQSSAFNKQRQFEELLSFSRRLNSY